MAAIPVFVSSTFRDFHGERDLLVGPVRERLDELVADLGCRVEMIDLRWGVDTTEDGEDEAQRRVLDVCLDQINRARPLFLGLAGERYGTVPDAAHARFVAGEAGVPADQVVEGRSITELEFGHGALWDSAPPGDHVILVRTIAGAVPTGWADANPDKVSRFRAWLGERARDRGSVQVLGYTATGTGSGVDLTALQTESGKVESFEDFVVQCLSRPVLARAREVIAQDERAGLDGPVRLFRDDREIMVGRDALRDQVVDSLAGRPSGRVLLLGSSGTGKSTLLCAVEAELRSRDVPVVSHLVGVGVGGRRPVDVVVSLAAQLGPMLGTELTVPSEAGSEDLRRWWSDTLSGAVGRLGSLVVVVDALDQIDGIDAQEVIWPVVSLPAGVGLLCSSTTPGHAGLLAPTGVETVPVGALSGPLAREAASRWALASGRSLPAPVLDVVGVEARLPLWVRVAVDLLGDLDADDFDRIADAPDQAAAIAGLLRQEVVALPAEPGGLAERLLDRVGDRVGSEVADQLVGLLAVARAGLSQADLVELLPDELGNRQLLVAQARRVLGGQVREQDAAGRLVFTHALVRQAALSRAPQDPHVLLARRLVAQDGYDRTGVLDLLWHVLHTAPDQVPQGSEHLAFALNTRVAGTELLFINALAVTSGAGLKVVAAVPPDTLTDTGLETLLAADERAGAERLPLRDRRVLAEINAQLARDHSGDDTARLLAAAVSNVGRVAMAAGDLAAARTAYTESLTTARRLAQADPGNAQAARDVSVSLDNVGRVAMAAGDLAAARTAYTEMHDILRRLAQADPGNAQAARDVSVSLDNVGRVAMAAGDLAAARTAYTEMHDILRRLAQADPGNAQAARDVSVSLDNVGRVAMAAGDLAAARTAYTESLTTARRLAQADPGNAQAARDVSVSLDNVGRVAMAAGDLAAARTAYTESLTTARRLAQADPGNAQAARDVSVSLNNVGRVAMAAGDLAAARTAYTESLTTARRLAQADPGNAQAARDVSVSLDNVGRVAMAAGDLAAARTAYTESLTTARRLAQADPGNAQAARDVSVSLDNVGRVAMAAGDLAAARTAYTESLTTRRRLAQADPGNAQAARDVSVSLDNVGRVAMAAGDLAAARTAYTESLTTARRLAQADPGNAQAARDVSVSLDNVGRVAMAAGDLAAARTAYTESLTTRRRLAQADPGNAQAARDVSVSLNNVGRVAMAAGDLAAARTAYTESLTTRRRLAQADPGNAQAARDVSVSLNNVGRVAMAAGDLAAARTAYTESLTTARRLAQADPGNAQAARDVSVSLDNVGRVAMAAGDLAAARTAYTESLTTRRRLAQADPGNAQAARDVSVSLDNVGRVAMAAGDLAAARTAYTESLTTARRLAQADPGNAQAARDVSVSLDNVGRVAMAAGDLAAARTAYTEMHDILRRLAQADPGNAQAARDVSVSLNNVGRVAMAAGDLAAARTAYTESLTTRRRLAQADPGNAQAARDVSISLWRLAELTDEVAGKDSEAAVLAWREVALDFEELGRRGWLLPADERAEAHARSRARQASKDVGTPDASVPSGIEALLSARGLLLAPEAASSTIDSFLGELGERVGMCLSVLLTDDAQDNFEALLERPDGADQAAILLREAVPSQPDLIRDVQATLVDELADVATDGVIPPLGIWPVALPDFGTRAEVVLWCRGYRPPETELRAASDRINEAAERRRWEEEAASLTPEQEQAMVHLRDQVEQGRAEPEAFAELWNSYHPNRAERYLFHLGEAIDDLLTEWRSAGAGQSSSTN